jgi:hypothetical protein
MTFTSQICTTKEQSERLLALGLKRETADMTYLNDKICAASYNEMECPYDNLVKPAWSLHRLIEMCPLIPNPSRFLAVTSFKTVYVRMNDEMDVCYAGKGTYNNLIDCIEWLIKEGYFNKDYLGK